MLFRAFVLVENLSSTCLIQRTIWSHSDLLGVSLWYLVKCNKRTLFQVGSTFYLIVNFREHYEKLQNILMSFFLLLFTFLKHVKRLCIGIIKAFFLSYQYILVCLLVTIKNYLIFYRCITMHTPFYTDKVFLLTVVWLLRI